MSFMLQESSKETVFVSKFAHIKKRKEKKKKQVSVKFVFKREREREKKKKSSQSLDVPVCCAGENVWEDIHPDSQEFIKEYLKQYPEVSDWKWNVDTVDSFPRMQGRAL